MAFFKTYIVTLLAFSAIDAVWLGVVAPDFYATHIGHLMAENVNWGAAVAFYLLYIAGIVKFGINTVDASKGWKAAALNGATFGLIAYATYDLTNYATLTDWPLIVVVADMIWGAFITGSTAAIGYTFHQRWRTADE
ncbi:DUF2177 family protein [Kordiimonas aquimaris]|uniref:DUF2177 family protein n=1 Tax=Kordiimonas aquimaris TaxID=707591 RepID=UPI0021CF66D1|nr:DUF2177 family protein [Kordiimonas aquimaris]